ncbi:hypothetical protein N7532_010777 [Penicillium argentinense]|uniref:STB6-like N-terminal domain-containing protein n=1 Tax=Penicillium argentinense TaxID=1131581 RepID=A0A9W9EQJ6_9EURO|nr:uncharacterized protein N7532_010777 [Penicillium argentinense]KAJ5086006.1 hypothetical protein N7532_010777 [Penicillium argentinense]
MQANAQVAPADRRDSGKASDGIRSSPASNANGPVPERQLQGHQRLVFTDPVALRYLEEDPSTDVLHRRTTLQGYEIYIVEQWACSRSHPTFVISTYTGDPSHTVVVGVLSVPTDETTWSPRLRMYFDAVEDYHARRKETPLGTIMVTDLGSFPSSLMVIPVPEGDIKKHRDDFIVNENLKRLGCAGRAGLKLQQPLPATEAKFHQLYRASERVYIYDAVIELVKQCQIALMVFDKLAPEYVDGLLCDVTEEAIGNWWADIGTELYNIEPSDGVLGPTTVAALLGTLLGARNRLHAYGAPVGKDAFDIDNLKRGIGGFQKSQKMNRSRRLDRRTLDRLHRATAKAANAEGWTDAIKSTMTELSGQGGEMVMGMVRGREKGNIADIETLDLDVFVQCVYGSRAKWLWLGKPRKTGSGLNNGFTKGPGSDMMFTTDDQGGYVWTSRKKHSTEDLHAERVASGLDRQWKTPESLTIEEKEHRKKGVSGRVSDARAGLGRFKDAVGLPGLRSHNHKQPRDGSELTHDIAYRPSIDSDTEAPFPRARVGSDLLSESKGEELATQLEENENAQPTAIGDVGSDVNPPEIHIESPPPAEEPEAQEEDEVPDMQPIRGADEESDTERTRTRSTAASSERGRDRDESASGLAMMALQRPQSCEELRNIHRNANQDDNRCPRHLSFSNVEEVVLNWESLGGQLRIKDTANLEEAIAQEDMLASDARIFSSRILELSEHTVPWVERQVNSVDGLNQVLYDRHEELNAVYLDRFGDYQRLRERSSDLLTDEHSHLTDGVKRVELLGAKLDYELHVLESKVDDVEEGVTDFERHIANVETRIKALLKGEEEHSSISWMAWVRRSFGSPAQ